MYPQDPKRSVHEYLTDDLLPRKSRTFMHQVHALFDWFGSCKVSFSFRKAKKAKIPGHHLHEYYMNYDNL